MTKRLFVFGWLLCGLLCAGAEPAMPVENSTINNFYRVAPHLYRSGQPNKKGFDELQTRGIRSVLNMRNHHSDDREARGTSIALYHLQTNAGDLTASDLLMALITLRAADKPALVHCWHGSDRTGTVIAAYRIVEEGWSVEQAIAELMEPRFGHHASYYKNIATLLRGIDWDAFKARYARMKTLPPPDEGASPRYAVAETAWAEAFGSQRAVLDIPEPATSCFVRVAWRRHDLKIADKAFRVVSSDGATTASVQRVSVNAEACELRVGPVTKGTYYFYYLPYTPGLQHGGFLQRYDAPEVAAALPVPTVTATVARIESRTAHDSRWPMEVCATAEECAAFVAARPAPYHVFGEARDRSVRMRDTVPAHWMDVSRPMALGAGVARPNEYFCFQGAVWASGVALTNVTVRWTGFRTADGAELPGARVTCFNTEGVKPNGTRFTQAVSVPAGHVQSFWFGVDIPADATPGMYYGTVVLQPKDQPAVELPVSFAVAGEVLKDRGDAHPEKMSRLRWLNSTFGNETAPIAPYGDVRVETNDTCHAGLHTFSFTDGVPLPTAIRTGDHSILAAPITFAVGGEAVAFEGDFSRATPGAYAGEGVATDTKNGVRFDASRSLAFDGWMRFDCTVTAAHDTVIPAVTMTVPFAKDVARFFMGAGRPGGAMPETYVGEWGKGYGWSTPWDSFWVGSVDAGLHVELLGSAYHGPLLNLYRPAPPPAWLNNGAGRVMVENGTVTVTTGAPVTLKANQPVVFSVAFLATPVKPLDTRGQFTNRYFHNPYPTDATLTNGVKIINVHHANHLNPVINYPFLTLDRIRTFADTWHAKGCKVKLYYTLREMTTAFPELWAFRSLGTELLAGGGGGGAPWLREHLVTGYTPQWYAPLQDVLPEVTYDAAVLTAPGESRLLNYYVEGLKYLVEQTGIDGLYLDDVSFDRHMLQRMRRAMACVKTGCVIDLHSNTGFSHGPATQYYDFMPYVDKVWFGESFRYNEMSPEAWLVEVSGIPFGLMGDMLQGGGNRWLGMVFGMTTRLPWSSEGTTADPRPMWAYWDAFGIADATMIGWWQAACPVRAVAADGAAETPVCATVYRKPDGATLVALGNFSDEEQSVRLHFADAGITQLNQPAITNFQEARTLPADAVLVIPPHKGFLLEYMQMK